MSSPLLIVQEAMIDTYRFINQSPDINMWSKLDAALPTIQQQLADLIDCDPKR